MANRIAVVTGASQGIGAAIATQFAVAGFYLALADRGNAEGRAALIEELRSRTRVISITADISVPADCERIFREAIAEFGKPDILINNAGVSTLVPLPEVTPEEFDRIFNTNAKGTLLMLRQAAIHLNDNGRVVNIASSTTMFPPAGGSIYAGSKAAIKIFTEVAAQELGTRGITVNSVLPGVTLTPMAQGIPDDFKSQMAATSPFKRLGEPDEIANVVSFLVSDAGHWITGQHILANGGGKA